MPNSRPTPEQRAEWRKDATDDLNRPPVVHVDGRAKDHRILALLDALEEAERESDSLARQVAFEDRP